MKQLGLFLKTTTLGVLFKTGGHYPRRCYQNHKSNYWSSAGRCPFPDCSRGIAGAGCVFPCRTYFNLASRLPI